MTTVVVTSSRSPHGNTRRVAEVIADELGAVVVTPDEATRDLLGDAGRIGFGSGIYSMSFDRDLVRLVGSLTGLRGTEGFVFATSGLPEPPFRRYVRRLERLLAERGLEVLPAFTCRGLDTWGPFGLVGGVNRGRPGSRDLARAREYARSLPG